MRKNRRKKQAEKTGEKNESEIKESITDKRKNEIRKILANLKTTKSSEIAEAINLSVSRVKAILSDMLEVVSEGKGRGTKYRLTND